MREGKNTIRPEILAPAGDWGALRSAVESGADAVYFGVKGLSMRNYASNFDSFELRKIMKFLKGHNRKGYLALNVMMFERDIPKIRKIIQCASEASVDALIVWDMAAVMLAQEFHIPVHLSTQAGVANSEACRYFYRLGIVRIILARECNIRDIRTMITNLAKADVPCEIETFIHGAMCLSISGRCFLSGYTFGKSANRGECLQPCRREFVVSDRDKEASYILGKNYLLSPKDLCTMNFFDQLIESGISAFKIEGRMRSAEYVAVVTACYRRALDAYFEGVLNRRLKDDLLARLRTVYNRGFSEGFYFGQPNADLSQGLEHNHEKVFLGEVVKFYKKLGVAEVRLRNGSLQKGQVVLFLGKSPASFVEVSELQINHEFVECAPRGASVGIKIPFPVRPRDKVYIWKNTDK